MQNPSNYNNYISNSYYGYTWWNYYQTQAYNSWVEQMKYLEEYQRQLFVIPTQNVTPQKAATADYYPLFSDPIWAKNPSQCLDWGEIALQQQQQQQQMRKQQDQELDLLKVIKDAIKYSDMDEWTIKKLEKKRARNRIRNEHKKEMRLKAKKHNWDNTYSKSFKPKSFGSGWAMG